MQLWLYDHSNRTRTTVSAEGDPVVIGRDPACDVVLTSSFVARRHAQIVRQGNRLAVEALCQAGTRVANKTVKPGEPRLIDFGDEIQIGPFALAVIGSDTPQGNAKHDDHVALGERLRELEHAAHTQLLDRMNLRVTGSTANDGAFREQVLQHLEEVLATQVAGLDDALMRFACGQHVRRLVIAEVVRQSAGRVQTEYKDGDSTGTDPYYDQALTDWVADVVDQMPLIFDPAAVAEDLAVAEDSFNELFHASYDSIEPGLTHYVVRRTLAKDLRDVIFGLGPLQDLLEMPSVSEIMVVGCSRIYIEKNGIIQATTRTFFSDEVLLSVIERILAPVGRRVDTSTPLVDARLPDGSRVNVVIHPLSLAGPCLTIRKFGWVPFTMDDLVERDTLSSQVAAFLQGCITGRANIVISGGTGSGKTTLLNVLGAYAGHNERIITIEESAELRLPQPHVVRLEGRPANVEGKGAYTIRELVRNSLRMRPDRIFVGEVRGPEALDMLQAMNTGHDGSLSTVHANNPDDAIKRLEALVLMAVDMPLRAIREQMVAAVDLVVQVARFADGRRRITAISEVVGIDPASERVQLEDIFVLKDPKQSSLRHTGYLPSFAPAMVERGDFDVDVFL